MKLDVNNQLILLHDILDEQTLDCFGSVSEYQQINRLVKSMMANNSITDEELQALLPEIYNYAKQGENSSNMEEHIQSNKENLNSWVGTIRNNMLH